MENKTPESFCITKVLKQLKKNPQLFKEKDLSFIVGLTLTEISKVKKYIFKNDLATRIKQDIILTDAGAKFLNENHVTSWTDGENSKRPSVNLEYLKLEKQPPTLTKAIRMLARHMLEDEALKPYSMEHNIYREILSKNSICRQICQDAKKYICCDKKIKLTDFYKTFMSSPYGLTKSLTSILLLYALIESQEELAIYELYQFQLKLDTNLYGRMLNAPERFEFQKTVINEIPVLKEISKVILPSESINILDLTKGLIKIIKELDKYSFNTSRLSKDTLRLRNAVIHAKDPITLFYRDIPKILSDKILCQCDQDFIDNFEKCVFELKNSYTQLRKELKAFTLKAFNATERKQLKERFIEVEEFLNDVSLKILYRNIKEDKASDELWIERIATFVNGSRVPKDWSDEDVADFKIKIKDYANKFLIIESTAGSSEIKLDKTMEEVLSQLLTLSKPKQMFIVRKIVNG